MRTRTHTRHHWHVWTTGYIHPLQCIGVGLKDEEDKLLDETSACEVHHYYSLEVSTFFCSKIQRISVLNESRNSRFAGAAEPQIRHPRKGSASNEEHTNNKNMVDYEPRMVHYVEIDKHLRSSVIPYMQGMCVLSTIKAPGRNCGKPCGIMSSTGINSIWLIFTPWIILISFLLAVSRLSIINSSPHSTNNFILHTLMTLLFGFFAWAMDVPGGFNLKNRSAPTSKRLWHNTNLCNPSLEQNLSHDLFNDWNDDLVFIQWHIYSLSLKIVKSFSKKNCLPVFCLFRWRARREETLECRFNVCVTCVKEKKNNDTHKEFRGTDVYVFIGMMSKEWLPFLQCAVCRDKETDEQNPYHYLYICTIYRSIDNRFRKKFEFKIKFCVC